MDLKRITPRDPDHLAYVRTFGCCVCGRSSDSHHGFGNRGTSIKPSDFGAVPLCRIHHTRLHSMGQQKFEKLHGVELMEVVANVLHHKITGQFLTMHLVVL